MKTIKKQQSEALGKLWRYFDYNKTKMAKELGVDVQTVYMWFTRKRISATGAILAERITNGFVTKQELRPDVNEWFGQ
jgi:DNA-binding transcriptional regulator YdaS (Cro superfamily)